MLENIHMTTQSIHCREKRTAIHLHSRVSWLSESRTHTYISTMCAHMGQTGAQWIWDVSTCISTSVLLWRETSIRLFYSCDLLEGCNIYPPKYYILSLLLIQSLKRRDRKKMVVKHNLCSNIQYDSKIWEMAMFILQTHVFHFREGVITLTGSLALEWGYVFLIIRGVAAGASLRQEDRWSSVMVDLNLAFMVLMWEKPYSHR